ncbi:hypothetical protein ABZ388_22125 [Micromonospora parva]|uniref:hypothetical protein n=1 Tax=Micromonospora parva TaxID=1464048 RepID=UPI0033DFD3B1
MSRQPRSVRANSAILLFGFGAVTLLLGKFALDSELPGLARLAVALLWAVLALPILLLLRWLRRIGGDPANTPGQQARSRQDDTTP